MQAPEERHTEDESAYCPDRRTVLASLALAAGGLAMNMAFPQVSEAKSAHVRRYAIVYKLNGGKHPAKRVKYVKRGEVLKVSQLKRPKKRGYKFCGWYANASLTRKAVEVEGTASRSKRVVYAKWKPKRYTITYKLGGGTTSRKLPASYTIESKRIEFATPKRKGYRFKGWYADPEFTRKKSAIKAGSTGDVKVYARWERIVYTIDYDLHGGKQTITLPKRYSVKSPEIRPLAPVKSGYRFAGWYADSGYKTSMPCIPTGSTGNLKLHAKWVSADYWDDHLETKCARVNRISGRMANVVPSLVFITDMHLPTNAMVSPELVRRVISKTNTNMVVFGGDAINTPVDRTDAIRMLRYVRNAFGRVEVHMVRGNHDGNGQGVGAGVYGDMKISASTFLSIAEHKSEVRDNGCIYCYRDDAEHQVRYIFLDSGEPNASRVDTTQLAWLKNRVLELGEGWTVLVFVHQFYTRLIKDEVSTQAVYDDNGKLIRSALDSIYDQAQATIAGVISGHSHKDYVEHSAKGYPMISTTCDAYGRGKPSMDYSYKLGTELEQAFEVVSLDTGRQKLYFTRIGAGKNRTFSYAPPKPLVEPEDPPEEPPADPEEPEPEPEQPEDPPVDPAEPEPEQPEQPEESDDGQMLQAVGL